MKRRDALKSFLVLPFLPKVIDSVELKRLPGTREPIVEIEPRNLNYGEDVSIMVYEDSDGAVMHHIFNLSGVPIDPNLTCRFDAAPYSSMFNNCNCEIYVRTPLGIYLESIKAVVTKKWTPVV